MKYCKDCANCEGGTDPKCGFAYEWEDPVKGKVVLHLHCDLARRNDDWCGMGAKHFVPKAGVETKE